MGFLKNIPFLVLISFLLLHTPASAQDEDSYTYETEFIWGINKNTSGGLIGGLILKKSFAISDDVFQTFGLELMNVKSSFEKRYKSDKTNNPFIWDKLNYLYSIRFQYGRDLILFRKAPQKGVQVIAMFSAGPSLGIIAPYYVEVESGTPPVLTENVPYQPGKHSFEKIWGAGRIFQGLQNSKITPGINLKTGLSFEFGTFKANVTGFEVGLLLDAYTSKVALMSGADQQSIFPTAFITLFYGARK